jgi:choline dehydrogenase-like flavoprotein
MFIIFVFYRFVGFLITAGGGHSQLFYCSSLAKCNKTSDRPDLQILFSPFGVSEGIEKELSSLTGVRENIILKYLESVMGKHAVTLVVSLSLPRSVGEIRLKDNNPMSHPVIDPKYFSHSDDLKIFVEGIRLNSFSKAKVGWQDANIINSSNAALQEIC